VAAEKMTQDLPIAIAGGGIGGLAAALALARRGLASQVFERRSAVSEDGAGIQIGPNGTKILYALGVAARLHPSVAEPEAISVRDGLTGRELTRLPLGHWIAQRHGAPYWTAHRQDLHAALLEAAEADPRITLATGTEITGYTNHDDRITAQMANGIDVTAAALIGADGLWSQLRTIQNVGVAPSATGKSAYRSVVAADAMPKSLSGNDIQIWLSPGAHVVHYPVRAGREFALVVIADEPASFDGWASAVPAEAVAAQVRSLAPALRELLSQAQTWRAWALQSLPPLQIWTDGRMTLLGDAAHPVLPFLAQGAVLALEDAVVLARHLADGSTSVDQQLSAFGRERQKRAARVASSSVRNGRIYHLAGPLAFARNTVLRTAPPQRLMASYDWLYGFEA
jgi:salicylate hydroxylase